MLRVPAGAEGEGGGDCEGSALRLPDTLGVLGPEQVALPLADALARALAVAEAAPPVGVTASTEGEGAPEDERSSDCEG